MIHIMFSIAAGMFALRVITSIVFDHLCLEKPVIEARGARNEAVTMAFPEAFKMLIRRIGV